MELIIFLIFIFAAWLIYSSQHKKLLEEQKEQSSAISQTDFNQPPAPLYIDKTTHLNDRDTCFVAIIDTESTGLAAIDEPISIGIILLEITVAKGELIKEIGRYYGEQEPTVEINPEASAVNGFTIDKLRNKKFDISEIKNLIDKADILIAHNAKFDYRMVWKIYEGSAQKIWACSIYSLKFYWSEFLNKKLNTLCEAFNIERKSPHNALSDCEALLELLLQKPGSGKYSATYLGYLIRNPWIPNHLYKYSKT